MANQILNYIGQILGVSTLNGETRLLKTDDNGILEVNATACIYYVDTVTPLGGSATFTGTTRDLGVASGGNFKTPYFNAFTFADQAGTMRIEMSPDNVTWYKATIDNVVTANTPIFMSALVLCRYYRVVFINGATLQTKFIVNTSFSNN